MRVFDLRFGDIIETSLGNMVYGYNISSMNNAMFISIDSVGDLTQLDDGRIFKYKDSILDKYLNKSILNILSEEFGRNNILYHNFPVDYWDIKEDGVGLERYHDKYAVFKIRAISYGEYTKYFSYLKHPLKYASWTCDNGASLNQRSGHYEKDFKKAIAISTYGEKINKTVTERLKTIICFSLSGNTAVNKIN